MRKFGVQRLTADGDFQVGGMFVRRGGSSSLQQSSSLR
jgi:hypothetical protein